jgi:hypothetical protein
LGSGPHHCLPYLQPQPCLTSAPIQQPKTTPTGEQDRYGRSAGPWGPHSTPPPPHQAQQQSSIAWSEDLWREAILFPIFKKQLSTTSWAGRETPTGAPSIFHPVGPSLCVQVHSPNHQATPSHYPQRAPQAMEKSPNTCLSGHPHPSI